MFIISKALLLLVPSTYSEKKSSEAVPTTAAAVVGFIILEAEEIFPWQSLATAYIE